MTKFLRRAWAEVHLDRLRSNLGQLMTVNDDSRTKICCVVKANAYGHDDESVAPCLESAGVDFFAVSNIKEAQKLRRYGIKGDVLILGYTPVEYASALAGDNIIQAAVSEEYVRELSAAACEAGVNVRVHMAVDTGMGRIGESAFDTDACAAAVKRAAECANISLEGLFTHYAAADSYDEDDCAYTEKQTEMFFAVCEKAEEAGVKLIHRHCLNSAGGAFHYDGRSTLVRYGIMLYGLKPDRSLNIPVDLVPVMDLKAAVSYVKTVPAGRSISYGRTFTSSREMTVATIPIGYADGYSRSLSGKAYVLINGRRAPLVGRVCMDQLMADVTGIPDVKEGTEVTLIGRNGDEVITADDLAAMCDTIGYEVVCGLSKRIPRVMMDNGEVVNVVEYY